LNGLGLTRDEEGAELPDIDSARREAIRQARPIMAEEVREGRLDLTGRIRVRSEGATVLELPFDTVIEIVPANRPGESRQ
jgi:uncharacterized heparinase superfamily protein